MAEVKTKPLGMKAYGSIGHLPESRRGPGDHQIHEGQARICTEKARDKHDFMAKYVRPDKIDGKYLPNVSGGEDVWNIEL